MTSYGSVSYKARDQIPHIHFRRFTYDTKLTAKAGRTTIPETTSKAIAMPLLTSVPDKAVEVSGAAGLSVELLVTLTVAVPVE
jgi:hypothetical protein